MEFWGEVQPVLAEIGGLFQEIFAEVGAILEEIFGEVMADSSGEAVNFSEIIKSAFELVLSVAKAVASGLQKALEGIRKFWDKHGKAVIKIVKDLWSIVSTAFNRAFKNLEGLIKAFTKFFQGDFEGGFKEIKKIVDGTWEDIKSIFSSFISIIETVVDEWIDDMIKALPA